MVKLTNEASQTSTQMTFGDFGNATSSQGSADGPKPFDSPIGPAIGKFGRGVVRASLSQSREKEKAREMSDTSGLRSIGSSRTASLQSSLESRLRARLEGRGSLEYVLTWRHWDMESGPQICALRAWAPRTSDKGFGGWPTTKAQEPGSTSEGYGACLNGVARMASYATPTVGDSKSSGSRNTQGSKANAGYSLTDQARGDLGSGRNSTSSPSETERPAALNPDLSRWLMGYRAGWGSCGATAMLSSRKSRRTSSKRT